MLVFLVSPFLVPLVGCLVASRTSFNSCSSSHLSSVFPFSCSVTVRCDPPVTFGHVTWTGFAFVDLVDFCNKWDIKLVHISTDYVYTNSINEVSENDIPIHGNNWYSYTKLLGDAYIELKLNDYLICRGTHKPKPFPYEKAWIDQTGNFDYVDVISGLIVQLIQSDSIGIFNIGTNIKSIFELASQTTPVKVAFRPSEVPGNTTMNVNKLNNAFKGINK